MSTRRSFLAERAPVLHVTKAIASERCLGSGYSAVTPNVLDGLSADYAAMTTPAVIHHAMRVYPKIVSTESV